LGGRSIALCEFPSTPQGNVPGRFMPTHELIHLPRCRQGWEASCAAGVDYVKRPLSRLPTTNFCSRRVQVYIGLGCMSSWHYRWQIVSFGHKPPQSDNGASICVRGSNGGETWICRSRTVKQPCGIQLIVSSGGRQRSHLPAPGFEAMCRGRRSWYQA
jgi:hypothetical protein